MSESIIKFDVGIAEVDRALEGALKATSEVLHNLQKGVKAGLAKDPARQALSDLEKRHAALILEKESLEKGLKAVTLQKEELDKKVSHLTKQLEEEARKTKDALKCYVEVDKRDKITLADNKRLQKSLEQLNKRLADLVKQTPADLDIDDGTGDEEEEKEKKIAFLQPPGGHAQLPVSDDEPMSDAVAAQTLIKVSDGADLARLTKPPVASPAVAVKKFAPAPADDAIPVSSESDNDHAQKDKEKAHKKQEKADKEVAEAEEKARKKQEKAQKYIAKAEKAAKKAEEKRKRSAAASGTDADSESDSDLEKHAAKKQKKQKEVVVSHPPPPSPTNSKRKEAPAPDAGSEPETPAKQARLEDKKEVPSVITGELPASRAVGKIHQRLKEAYDILKAPMTKGQDSGFGIAEKDIDNCLVTFPEELLAVRSDLMAGRSITEHLRLDEFTIMREYGGYVIPPGGKSSKTFALCCKGNNPYPNVLYLVQQDLSYTVRDAEYEHPLLKQPAKGAKFNVVVDGTDFKGVGLTRVPPESANRHYVVTRGYRPLTVVNVTDRPLFVVAVLVYRVTSVNARPAFLFYKGLLRQKHPLIAHPCLGNFSRLESMLKKVPVDFRKDFAQRLHDLCRNDFTAVKGLLSLIKEKFPDAVADVTEETIDGLGVTKKSDKAAASSSSSAPAKESKKKSKKSKKAAGSDDEGQEEEGDLDENEYESNSSWMTSSEDDGEDEDEDEDEDDAPVPAPQVHPPARKQSTIDEKQAEFERKQQVDYQEWVSRCLRKGGSLDAKKNAAFLENQVKELSAYRESLQGKPQIDIPPNPDDAAFKKAQKRIAPVSIPKSA